MPQLFQGVPSQLLQHATNPCLTNQEVLDLRGSEEFHPTSQDLIVACSRGLTSVVAWILDDTNLNPAVKKSYPLCTAAENGHVEVVRLLL